MDNKAAYQNKSYMSTTTYQLYHQTKPQKLQQKTHPTNAQKSQYKITVSLSFLPHIHLAHIPSHHLFLSFICPKAKPQHSLPYYLSAVFCCKQCSAMPPQSVGLSHQPPTQLGSNLTQTSFFLIYNISALPLISITKYFKFQHSFIKKYLYHEITIILYFLLQKILRGCEYQ